MLNIENWPLITVALISHHSLRVQIGDLSRFADDDDEE